MISNAIIKEIIMISKLNKIIHLDLIKKIIEDAIEQSDEITKSIFKQVIFNAFYIKGTMAEANGNIFINNRRLIEEVKTELSLGRSFLEINFYILFMALHEIEHVKEEFKIYTSTDNSVKFYILATGEISRFDEYSQKEIDNELGIIRAKIYKTFKKEIYNDRIKDRTYKKYLDSYIYNPLEKIADIDASKQILASVDNYPCFKKYHSDLYKKLYNFTYDRLCKGYDTVGKGFNIPIVEFYTIMGNPGFLHGIDCYSDDYDLFLEKASQQYDSEQKMRYGFPITSNDLLKIRKKMIR